MGMVIGIFGKRNAPPLNYWDLYLLKLVLRLVIIRDVSKELAALPFILVTATAAPGVIIRRS